MIPCCRHSEFQCPKRPEVSANNRDLCHGQVCEPEFERAVGAEEPPGLHSSGCSAVRWISAEAPDIHSFRVGERVQIADPSPRVKITLPVPDTLIAAALLIKLLIERITQLLGSTGISDTEATTVASAPNFMKTRAADVFVTTTESPPPIKSAFAEVTPADRLTEPVGRNGLTEPMGMRISPLAALSRRARRRQLV